MNIKILKSKIHRATITEACLDYEGSISIDINLMEKAGIINHEKVHILNLTNGNRLETYVIPSGKKGSICINGAAAHLMHPGEMIIIVSYAQMNIEIAKKYTPTVVCVDSHNQIKNINGK